MGCWRCTRGKRKTLYLRISKHVEPQTEGLLRVWRQNCSKLEEFAVGPRGASTAELDEADMVCLYVGRELPALGSRGVRVSSGALQGAGRACSRPFGFVSREDFESLLGLSPCHLAVFAGILRRGLPYALLLR